jgi:hypothetical protein
MWEFATFPNLTYLNVSASTVVSTDWHVSASAYITHICPNILSVHTDVPWRGHLHIIQSDITKFIPTLHDVDTAHDLELEVAMRSSNWMMGESV